MALLYLVLVLLCHHISPSISTTNTTDLHGLLSFKSMISQDPYRVLDSWNNSVHFCRWQGVICGVRHPERVVALELDSAGLAGALSPALANLTFLQRVSLSNNLFRGPIPQELGRLFRLRHLNLSINSFQGSIPSTLSHCTNLRVITLRQNNLQGRIPPDIGNCLQLHYINLGSNSLTGGIPPSLGNLTALSTLVLSANNLTGSIPPSIFNLSSLTSLLLAQNQLTGRLPTDIGLSLPNLQTLYLSHNQFDGTIPSSLSNASSLEYIELYFNEFSGTIPPSLGALQSLSTLVVTLNELEAETDEDWAFMTALTNCTNLQVLQLDDNRLGGKLPSSIANLSSVLDRLTFGYNQISGMIPREIGNLVGLTVLVMGPNLLTGVIPSSIGRLQLLQQMDLSRNKLAGEIPPELGNATQLIALFLDFNELSGSIPPSLGRCKGLNLLNLGQNKLTGAIPKEIVTISSLSWYFSLSQNQLTGLIPAEVGSLTSLTAFDVSSNQLSGEIPSSLGQCQVLQYLLMDGNHLQGSIPPSLSALKGIHELTLSDNNLSGPIPTFLEQFRALYHLNLSFNNFEGEVPKHGVFTNVSGISVAGNSRLCGGVPVLDLPPCPVAGSKKHKSSRLEIIFSAVGGFICFVLLFLILAFRCKKRNSRRKASVEDPMKEKHAKISYSELVKATDSFSASNLIGVGSFGSVYRGVLRDGDERKVVAIKVLNLQQKGASKSFVAECEALRSIRHRNLVKIITSCSSEDFKGNDFKALVFEFMPNGSLENWLHPEVNEQSVVQNLSLMQRLNIAMDVASALDYLHHHGETPIVHCDLKPSNVLLDDDMTAHVGDFGLARFLMRTASKPSHNSTSSIGLKGSIGYVAPEYGVGSKVSTQGDVYSYGILLLEMFTGKRPTDDMFKEGLSLRRYVEMAVPGNLIDIMDARLLLDQGDEEAGTETQNIDDVTASMLRIGILCSKESPAERMQMGDVLRELHAIRDEFLRARIQGARSKTQLRGEGPSSVTQY